MQSLSLLGRGLVRTRRPVFVGRGTKIRGVRRISWGRGVSVGRQCSIDGYAADGVRFQNGSRLGDYVTITCTSHVTRMGRGFTLGKNSGLGDHCHVGASGGVEIGDNVIGGSFISFHAQDHVFDRADIPIREQGVREAGIRIGDNCWIGAKATFLDGADVGPGCVIAAGAVVKGRFPPRVVIGGVPARIIKHIDASE